MQKRVFILLIFLICSAFAFSAEAEEEKDIDKLIDDYSNIKSGTENSPVIGELNGLSETQRNEFLGKIAQDSGVSGLENVLSKFKEFDTQGNVVLEDGKKVDLKSLYNYANEGGSSQGYNFQGKSYTFDAPKLKDVTVDGDSVVYEFENGAHLRLDDGATFDFEKKEIKIGEKSLEWSNLDGEVTVEGDSVSLGMISDSNAESDLKNFPIVKGKDGEVISPYKEGKDGITIPADFKKPSKGKFKEFKKDGKTYTVDSEGGVYEIKHSKISLGESGEIDQVSEVMVDLDSEGSDGAEGGKFGEFYTTKDTSLIRGGDVPTDKSKSFIWVSEDGEKKSVVINSASDGKMYYNQGGELEDLELNGNVVVKNGGYFLTSDTEGNIGIRKIGGEESKLEYPIEKLFSEKKKDAWITIKEYEGDDEKLTGSLAIYNSKGKVAFGGGVIGGVDSELKVLKIQDPNRYSRERIIDIGRVAGEPTSTNIHEGTHVLNGELSNEFFRNNPDSHLIEGNTHSHGYRAFYLGDGEYVMIKKTPFKTNEIVGYLPQEFQNKRFGTYVSGMQGPYEIADNLFDEYSAYQAATRYRIEAGDDINGINDYLSSNSQFGVFTVAGAMKLQAEAPEYWNSQAGADYRALTNTFWKRSFDYANQVSQKFGPQYTSQFNSYVQTLKTSPSAANMRSFIQSDMPGLATQLGL